MNKSMISLERLRTDEGYRRAFEAAVRRERSQEVYRLLLAALRALYSLLGRRSADARREQGRSTKIPPRRSLTRGAR